MVVLRVYAKALPDPWRWQRLICWIDYRGHKWAKSGSTLAASTLGTHELLTCKRCGVHGVDFGSCR